MNGSFFFFFFKPETEFIMCQGKVRKGLCVCVCVCTSTCVILHVGVCHFRLMLIWQPQCQTRTHQVAAGHAQSWQQQGKFLKCLEGQLSSSALLPNWIQVFKGSLLPLRHTTRQLASNEQKASENLTTDFAKLNSIWGLWVPLLISLLKQTIFASLGGCLTDVST